MSKKIIALPAVCMLAFLWLGCAHSVTVDVKGTQKTEAALPSHVTYAVLPSTEVEKDRAFPDYAKLVAKQLEDRGYRQTDAKVAKLGAYLAYSVSDKSAGSKVPPASQDVGAGGGMTPGSGNSGYGYGAVASSPSGDNAHRYATQVVIVVIDLTQSHATGSLVELWRGEAMTAGGSNDLAGTAPILIDAAFRHFGETTPKPVQHTFGEEDLKKLREVR